ncbi:5-hydroxymethyluracil DNA glycosylase [Thalassospira profundimaris]|uniref:Formamidopyrimidine-DNA glycosylase n=1 Tax=Thalassospira profundimaris TaxID=502049 RepID=A0A367WMB4_9PROT|nr:bifunctional DNA-formamidopyrimidine glycosylase/DNA-(apurinic or apyrimidinic site) lyase [Thalassospira profundimaris]RCK42574.1 5-hydroxymethyluracil DNA glycosylase [Thalassospira profundimaris]
MPELPEVETVCRGLAPVMEGRVLASVVQRRPNLRTPFPDDFVAKLTGRRVNQLTRRAKYVMAYLDDGQVLLIHLGMSGRMTVIEPKNDSDLPEAGKHDHVDFVMDSGVLVRFNDPRRFGLMALTDMDALPNHPMLVGIGPEPLGNQFNAAMLAEALVKRKSPIKTTLLDQRLVAGLGNIYVCEALFRSRIDPQRLANSLTRDEIDLLYREIRAVLEDAIRAGGSSLRDHRQANGELGYFQHNFRIYGREGEPCITPECGGTVGRLVQGGRSTFYCPVCQH